MAKTGRPSSYSEEVASKILLRIAEGESLRSICKDDDMPNASTVHAWNLKNEKFAKQYARAREDQADTLFDECLYIADTDTDSQRARLRIDTRKWMAGKLKSSKYSDKIELNHSGSIETATKEQRDAAIAAAYAADS